jgi:hypothetical protein
MNEDSLTEIMLEEMKLQGDGSHPIEPFIQRVYARCQAEGLSFTLQDVRREYRDSCGYP